MGSSTSARRGGEPSAAGGGGRPWVAYGIIGFGAVLVVLAFATQLMGESVYHETLSPARSSGSSTTFTTGPIDLADGLFDVHLSIREPRGLLSFGRMGFEVTSPDRSSWFYSGSLKLEKKKKNSTSTRRRRYRGSRLITVEEPGSVRLEVSLAKQVDERLDVGVKKVAADYRYPLYLGFVLIALGLLMSPEVRTAVAGLPGRFSK